MQLISIAAAAVLSASMAPASRAHEEVLAEGRAPTHCRLIARGDGTLLPIMDFGIADVVTAPRENYEIVGNVWGAQIEGNDLFYVTLLPTTGSVRVDQKRPKSGNSNIIGTGELMLDSSKLWMRGPVRHAGPNGVEILGELFVFRAVDAGTYFGSGKCMHTAPNASPVCKRFHFEYYRNGDTANLGHRPSLGANVKPIAEVPDCALPFPQTGEGDGDNGPEYP